MNRLPDKPSELLLLALTDLEQVENDPRYVVNMVYWHVPDGKCAVCLAGSVMAKSLAAPTDAFLDPGDFDYDTGSKLRALDDFRCGDIGVGLAEMGVAIDDIPKSLMRTNPPVMYSTDRDEFFEQMLTIVGVLQAEGL